MTQNALLPLKTYSRDVYSQFGEDGIIEEILNRIARVAPVDHWCVEFGAWDGVYLSNTCNLIRNKGYKAVLIEGNPTKYKDLCKNIPSADVIKICRFVNFEGDAALEAILKQSPIPKDFDFLSIDIDGCDYFILESLAEYRPKLVCIEFNSTIPNEVDYVQPKDFSVMRGSSPKALARLAVRKGYALVAATECNLFFVREDLKAAVIGGADVTLESLRDDSDCRAFIFCGYDGTILSNKTSITMPWHKLELRSENLQQLPWFLRRFPSNFNPLQQFLFDVFLAFNFPSRFLARFTKKARQ